MPSPDRLLAFTLLSLLLIVVPGPSVLFVISRALAYGRQAALTTVWGGAVGSLVMAAAISVGLGAVVETSALAYSLIKFAGAGYLVYLGVRAFRHRGALRAAFERQVAPVSGPRVWWEGFVVGATNPKSAVFFAAVLPQFADPEAGHASVQMVVLGAIFAVIALASDTVWGLAAGAVRSWFARSARRLEFVGGAAGLTMVGLGVGLAATGRRD